MCTFVTHIGIDPGVAHCKWAFVVQYDSTEGRRLIFILFHWCTTRDRQNWLLVAPE